MDLTIFRKFEITPTEIPSLTCPVCDARPLGIVESSFNVVPDVSSPRVYTDFEGDWEYDESGERGAFTIKVQCPNKRCGQILLVLGEQKPGYHQGHDERIGDYEGFHPEFFPLYFHPCLEIFKIPSATPPVMSRCIWRSFALFFADPDSAANHVRCCVEAFCDINGPPPPLKSDGTPKFVPLEKRLAQLPPTLAHHFDALLALKWMGNAGSHAYDLTHSNVVDTYSILSKLLRDLYAPPDDISPLILAINANQGPAPRP